MLIRFNGRPSFSTRSPISLLGSPFLLLIRNVLQRLPPFVHSYLVLLGLDVAIAHKNVDEHQVLSTRETGGSVWALGIRKWNYRLQKQQKKRDCKAQADQF